MIIEVFSFLARPVSRSVRLFANMLAGHITLKVFAGFATMLGGFGSVGWLAAAIPLAMTVALTALELLIHHPHMHLSRRCPPPEPLEALRFIRI